MSGVYFCFFLSGISALVYEIVWSRILTRTLGESLYAVATITALFLGGLAIGAAAGGILCPKRGADGQAAKALRAYSCIELLVALYGIAIPLLLSASVVHQIWPTLAFVGTGQGSYVVRVILAAVLLLPPTALMGATFPLLVCAGCAGRDAKVSEQLYAFNTTGAVLGCVLATFVLLPSVGINTSSWVAAGLNAVAAAFGFSLAWRWRETIAAGTLQSATAAPKKTRKEEQTPASLPVVLLAAFFTGFLALVLEVAWTRLFALVLGSSTYSLGSVLAFVLLGLALGAWLVSAALMRLKQPLVLICATVAVSAVYTLVALYLFNDLPWGYLSLAQLVGSSGQFTFAQSLFVRVLLVAAVVLIPSAMLGAGLPLLFQAVDLHKDAPLRIGQLYAFNTVGAISGACLTGFVLIPWLGEVSVSGIQTTIALAVIGQVLLAVWLFFIWSKGFVSDRETHYIVNGVVLFVVVATGINCAFFRPEWNQTIMSAGASFYAPSDVHKLDKETFLSTLGLDGKGAPGANSRLLFYREGLNSTVTVGASAHRNVTFLKNDGKVEAAVPTDPGKRSIGSDLQTHQDLAVFPLALHEGPAKTALVIGYGSGVTSGVLADADKSIRLVIAELEPAVYAANRFFVQVNSDPLNAVLQNEGRVRRIVNDGRYVLAVSPDRFDLIVSQPADPWVSGASELYTREFWSLARSRLAPGGIFSQWIQLYSMRPQDLAVMLRTFAKVFPDCLLVHSAGAAECVVLGFNGSHKPMENLQRRTGERLNATQVERFIAALSQSGTTTHLINTDDNLFVEYAAARQMMTQQQNIDANIGLLHQAAGM